MPVYDKNGNVLSTVCDKNGNPLIFAYDKNGNEIFRGHAISRNYTKSLMYLLDLPAGIQGIACDSITQTIAQFYTGHVYLIDLSDGNYTHPASAVNLGHGDTGQFAPTKTDDQEYPLLYISTGNRYTVNDAVYSYMLEFMVTSSSYQCKRVFAVPSYSWVSGTDRINIDFENNVLYHIYTSTYYGEAEYTYIDAWDMSTLTELSDASYTPNPSDGFYMLNDLLSSFTIPFVPETQSTAYFDGMVCLLSDKTKYVQFIDVVSQSVYMTIPLNEGGEWEGIGFLYNSETEQYDMILSKRDASQAWYYRYQFDLD